MIKLTTLAGQAAAVVDHISISKNCGADDDGNSGPCTHTVTLNKSAKQQLTIPQINKLIKMVAGSSAHPFSHDARWHTWTRLHGFHEDDNAPDQDQDQDEDQDQDQDVADNAPDEDHADHPDHPDPEAAARAAAAAGDMPRTYGAAQEFLKHPNYVAALLKPVPVKGVADRVKMLGVDMSAKDAQQIVKALQATQAERAAVEAALNSAGAIAAMGKDMANVVGLNAIGRVKYYGTGARELKHFIDKELDSDSTYTGQFVAALERVLSPSQPEVTAKLRRLVEDQMQLEFVNNRNLRSVCIWMTAHVKDDRHDALRAYSVQSPSEPDKQYCYDIEELNKHVCAAAARVLKQPVEHMDALSHAELQRLEFVVTDPARDYARPGVSITHPKYFSVAALKRMAAWRRAYRTLHSMIDSGALTPEDIEQIENASPFLMPTEVADADASFLGRYARRGLRAARQVPLVGSVLRGLAWATDWVWYVLSNHTAMALMKHAACFGMHVYMLKTVPAASRLMFDGYRYFLGNFLTEAIRLLSNLFFGTGGYFAAWLPVEKILGWLPFRAGTVLQRTWNTWEILQGTSTYAAIGATLGITAIMWVTGGWMMAGGSAAHSLFTINLLANIPPLFASVLPTFTKIEEVYQWNVVLDTMLSGLPFITNEPGSLTEFVFVYFPKFMCKICLNGSLCRRFAKVWETVLNKLYALDIVISIAADVAWAFNGNASYFGKTSSCSKFVAAVSSSSAATAAGKVLKTLGKVAAVPPTFENRFLA